VGGLGALTTFSTFASDTLALADEGRRRVGGHVAATVVLGLGAALVGLAIGS
jgi:fluoride ion exporter CrcB/FEX